MISPDLTLRKATKQDLELLRYWDNQPHKKEADPFSDWQWETELGTEVTWREQLIAEISGRPIGFIELLHCAEDPEHYWGDVPDSWMAIDIWIGEASDIGRGYGSQMLSQALERCFTSTLIRTVVLDPISTNIRARRFYERHGFRFVEERWFDLDLCAVYRLDKADWIKGSNGRFS